MVDERRKSLRIRDLYETVLNRAHFLEAPDQALLEQVIGRGVRPIEVAKVAGLSTRTVQRRVRLLTRRLLDPRVEYVLRHYHQWPAPLSQIALGVWARQWTLRKTADRLGLSLHQVRQHVAAVRGLIDAGLPRRRRIRRIPRNQPIADLAQA